IKGKTWKLPPDAVLPIDQDLFIDSTLLQQWFPLELNVDHLTMTLNIAAREPLPFEEKIRRDKTRTALEQQKQPLKEPTYKTIDYPYSSASWPFTNVTFGPSYQSQDKQTRADYSVLAVGDLGYMTSRLYAAGNLDDKVVSDLRFS